MGISLAKELAPVMMAILIAGRIGSAMAAEIGSMWVYQEVDALRTMNINPVHYLVLPRLVAIAVALPLLVVFAILVGWLGGAVVAETNSHIEVPFQAFWANLRDVVELKDVVNGVFKSFCFAHDHWRGLLPSRPGNHRRAARHRPVGHESRRQFHRPDRDF